MIRPQNCFELRRCFAMGVRTGVTLGDDYIDLMRQAPFMLGALEIRPASREVVTATVREVLEPRVMQVLVALARQAGEVVSRDTLIAQCWAGRVVGDDAINRCIGRVRRLSETHGGFALETLPRIGYRLNLLPDSAPVEPPAPLKSKPRAALLIGAVVVACVALWFVLRPAPPTPAAPSNFSIAVLPFTPLYVDPSAQHLGDSIAASVADMLSGYGLDVVSPAKSFQFRGAAKAKAVQALHADFIVDGEVRRERGSYLVAIRIIAGDSGTTLLAENFERPVGQEADLPENVAGEVAELEWFVTTGFGRSGLWDRRVMAGALRATHLMHTRDDASAANDIARHLEEIAPEDPFAYAIHVRTALQMAREVSAERQAAYLAEARKAAEAAIRIDPSYADAYALHAMTMPMVDWVGREREFKRALTILPKAPIGYMLAVEFLQNTGRFQESVRLAEQAYAANPYLSDVVVKTGNSRLWSGQTQSARELMARGSRLFHKGPWFPGKLFELAAFYGAPGDAQKLLQDPFVKNALEPPDAPQVFSKIALALKTRDAVQADAVASECRRTEGRTAAMQRACITALAALGKVDDFYRLAEALYPDQQGATPAQRDRKWLAGLTPSTAYLLSPPTAAIRRDPRFRGLAERLGLLAYWKTARPDFCAREKLEVCRL